MREADCTLYQKLIADTLMNAPLPFALSEDDESLAMLAATLAAVLRDHEDTPEQLWDVLAREIGLNGAILSERYGGMGGAAGELWVVMEALGRSPGWTPYLASSVLGAGALRHAGGALADAILPGVARGEVTIALAFLEPGRRNAIEPLLTRATLDQGVFCVSGIKVAALGLDTADFMIVSAAGPGPGTTLFCIATNHPGLSRTAYATIDGESAADATLDNVMIPAANVIGQPGHGGELLERLIDEGTAAACAAACGTLRAMIERTVEYCRQRRQFGKALSDFQVLQHRLVDMHIAVEQATSLSQLAFAKLGARPAERRMAVSGAKYLVAEACRSVSQGAVQLHGGIGTTDELAISRFFKRALMLEHLFGGTEYHLERYMAARKENSERADQGHGPTVRQ